MSHDLILFLVGIVVGAMNAIAGGGMLVGFPVLLAFGLSPLVANVTSSVMILPGSVSSAYGYRKYLRRLHHRYLMLLIPCILGSAIGALLLRNTPSAKFQEFVPALVIFAVVLFTFQPFIHLHLRRHIRNKRKGLRPLLLISAAFFPVAIYGGYFGAGLGFIMLAFLGFTKIHEIHQMNGMKNVASAFVGLTSLLCLYSSHLIAWRYGLVMAAGSVTGGFYGAMLTQRFSTHTLRIIVISIGFGTAGYLAFRSY